MPVPLSADVSGVTGYVTAGDYVYGEYQNTGATAIVPGQLVVLTSRTTCRAVLSTDTRGLAYGVSLDNIPVNGKGRVVTQGPVTVIVGGTAVAAGNQVVPDFTGLQGVVPASGTTVIRTIGVALTAGAANSTCDVFLETGVFPA
jgi:hypothetical protein